MLLTTEFFTSYPLEKPMTIDEFKTRANDLSTPVGRLVPDRSDIFRIPDKLA